ncbi:hypothetical protein KUTeg_020920 [Tegillarca granosa]|uniref:G-protein coupled receptors family 3 profile domain-containing protein n=1 Tax=Tegillarca granosa TaxID=220873 RepID=A0ABQ9EFA5_TEGGR|nr:hypothetical protein KUTeg_020920 [Tegillarca granosa]
MDFWQRLFLTIIVFFASALCCSYGIGYDDQFDTPIWDVQGGSKILVLMDLHRHMSENGTCSDMNPRMVERALAMKWLSSVLQSEVGLTIFDTCGSRLRAAQIVTRHIMNPEQSCSNTSDMVLGVLSHTRDDITDAISNILQPLGILHIKLDDNGFLTKKDNTSFTIPTFSIWKLEAVLQVLKNLNWNYISAFSDGTDNTNGQLNSFIKMAIKHSICLDKVGRDLSNVTSLKPKPEGVVIFTSDVQNVESLIGKLNPNQKYMIVNNNDIGKMSLGVSGTILHLSEILNSRPAFLAFVASELLQSSDSLSKQYLSDLEFCKFNSTFNQTICDERLNSYLEIASKRYDILAAMMAYYNAHRVIQRFGAFNCSGYDFSSCPSAFTFVRIKPSVNEFPFNLEKISDNISLDEEVRVDVSVLGIPTAQVGIVTQTSFSPTNLIVWKKVKTDMKISDCGTSCQQCGTCKHNAQVENDYQNEMMENGDILIMGSFPIRQLSHTGETCGMISEEGIQLSEALLYAVDTIKSRYRAHNLFPGVNVGAVIKDKCQVSKQEFCPSPSSDWTETANHNGDYSSIEIFRKEEYFDNRASQARFLLTDFGVSLHKILLDRYVKGMSDLFRYANWTYIHVVYSEEILADIESSVNKYLQEKDICTASRTVLNYNRTSTLSKIETLMNNIHKTATILLLTNFYDTKFIMNVVNQSFSYDDLNFVILPWDIKSPMFAGTVVFRPKPEIDTNFNNYLSSLKMDNQRSIWWRTFYEDTNKCHVKLEDGIAYPAQCSQSQTVMTNSSVSPAAYKVIQTADAVLLIMDRLYKDLCPFHTGLCREFLEFDIKSYIRKNLIQGDSSASSDVFTDRGELKFPLDIINYQIVDETTAPVSVGIYSSRDDLIVDKNAIKTYNSDKRPYVASHVCDDWCPSCYACKSAITKQNGFLYHSGDVVVTSVFPMHKKGAKTFSCGPFGLNKGSEVLTEAFMYAIGTSKSRYPYLFPNLKIGSLTIDSCSDTESVLQTIMNFESCITTFANKVDQVPVSPLLVPGYLSYDYPEVTPSLDKTLKRLDRFHESFDSKNGGPLSQLFNPYFRSGIDSLVHLLIKMNWTYVDLIVSSDQEHQTQKHWFMEMATSYNICVSVGNNVLSLESSMISTVITSLSQSQAKIVVVLASTEVVQSLFGVLVNRPLSKMFILGEETRDWQETGILLPEGSIIVNRVGKINSGFKAHYEEAVTKKESRLGNIWFGEMSRDRVTCLDPHECTVPSDIVSVASKIVFGVDAMLHALHFKYKSLCPSMNGLCKNFADVGSSLNADDFKNFSFRYQDEMIELPPSGNSYGTYVMLNRQKSGYIEVGKWKNGAIKVEPNKIKAYDSSGNQLRLLPSSVCYRNCKCENKETVENITATPEPSPRTDLEFFGTTQQFNSELWAIVVLTISCGSALVSLMFIVYVIMKVCGGLLQKRYIGLGIMLLVSIVTMYLSVLPFVFTPGENICSLRFFLPGLTYALTFAVIMAKLMSLRAYKLIGLGGEISNLNQFLTVLFVTGVQLAIGIHWWIKQGSLFVVDTSLPDVTQYACKFDKTEFVIYLVYIMFLIVLAAFYAILVRNETKNMGEAKLILISSWMTIAVWVAWIAVLIIQPKDYEEPTVCVGIIVTASVTILVVFVPKLHRISKLKYDVKKSAGMENGGYKIDPDFLFERPYTLPAMRTSFKYSEKTNPKSISKFDSSLSY